MQSLRRECACLVRTTKFELYQDKKGEWRWRRTATNGNIVGASSEGYKSNEGRGSKHEPRPRSNWQVGNFIRTSRVIGAGAVLRKMAAKSGNPRKATAQRLMLQPTPPGRDTKPDEFEMCVPGGEVRPVIRRICKTYNLFNYWPAAANVGARTIISCWVFFGARIFSLPVSASFGIPIKCILVLILEHPA